MVATLSYLLVLLTFLSSVDAFKFKNKKNIYFIFGFFLFLLCALRKEGVDRDYKSYVHMFENFKYSIDTLELSFVWISYFIHLFTDNPQYLFITYAFIGVCLKLTAIKQLSSYVFISLFLYFCYYYNLHELTQIRVGAALSFVLLSIKPLVDRDKLKIFCFMVLAILFHNSAFVVLLLFFLNVNKINKIWSLLIPISYLCYFIGYGLFNLLALLKFDFIIYKLKIYAQFSTSNLNVFNVWIILQIVFVYILLSKIDIIHKNNKYSIILLKMYILSICVVPLLSINAVFASRISDIFSISSIVLLPNLIYCFSSRKIAVPIILVYGFIFFYLNIYYIGIIT